MSNVMVNALPRNIPIPTGRVKGGRKGRKLRLALERVSHNAEGGA